MRKQASAPAGAGATAVADEPVVEATTPTGESRLALVRRARRINAELALTYPDAHCELDFTTPLELLDLPSWLTP